ILALPVIYHEFLHYGGPLGKPEDGIANETEVLLREILFARSLIARLAPKKDEELSAFERSLVDEIHAVGMQSLQWQLGCDLLNDSMLREINDEVIKLYGDKFSEDEARHRLALQIGADNRGIELENGLLTWTPEKKWPELGSETPGITALY